MAPERLSEQECANSTLTADDSCVAMTKNSLVNSLGDIVSSGTKALMKTMFAVIGASTVGSFSSGACSAYLAVVSQTRPRLSG